MIVILKIENGYGEEEEVLSSMIESVDGMGDTHVEVIVKEAKGIRITHAPPEKPHTPVKLDDLGWPQ